MPSEIPRYLEGVPVRLGEVALFGDEVANVRSPALIKQDRVGGDLAHLEVQRRREHSGNSQDDRAVARRLEILELAFSGKDRGSGDVENVARRFVAERDGAAGYLRPGDTGFKERLRIPNYRSREGSDIFAAVFPIDNTVVVPVPLAKLTALVIWEPLGSAFDRLLD